MKLLLTGAFKGTDEQIEYLKLRNSEDDKKIIKFLKGE